MTRKAWVFDFKGSKAKAEELCTKWNADIKAGRKSSPKGSHYITGEPKELKDRIGIYFVDPTAKCERCGGTGWIEIIEYPASGAAVQKVPCPKCVEAVEL